MRTPDGPKCAGVPSDGPSARSEATKRIEDQTGTTTTTYGTRDLGVKRAPGAGGRRRQESKSAGFFIPAAALGESRSSARGIGVGELSAEMEWLEKNLQENFDLPAKHPSEEALRRWRSAVGLVKNRRRRFRFMSDLDGRSENESQRRDVQVLPAGQPSPLGLPPSPFNST